ncbi:potassium channel family protein [Haloarchaeobius baliensis]|uniref:potassium channel family protein n=1 Tax=Haloarchaeobius baliensis TaxID=1670458 RepID=UPI003F88317C
MYVIVIGAGDIGDPLIDMATANGHEVVVVEEDPDTAARASGRYDCLVLEADATVAETLEEAGASRADAIISTTDSDATNIMVMLLADEFGVPSRVSVVHDPEHMPLFRRSGANVIENPQKLISEHLLRAVQRPSVKDWLHLAGDAEVFEVTVTDEAPVADRRLRNADEILPEDVLVVAIEREDSVVTPRGDTVVEGGDLVTVFSKRGFDDDVLAVFGAESVDSRSDRGVSRFL